MAISQHLREHARSCYHGYLADFVLNGRCNQRLARRAEEYLVRSVVEASRRRPTKAKLLKAFKALIEEVEAEWDSDVPLPPRPHGL